MSRERRRRGRVLAIPPFLETLHDAPACVFVRGPVAVATNRQGTGIGQAPIRQGHAQLRGAGVEVALA